MKLGTLRLGEGTAAVWVSNQDAQVIEGFSDLGSLLAQPNWRDLAQGAAGQVIPLGRISEKSWAPVIPHPGKIVCVGLNYKDHIREMGHQTPDVPTIFAKYAEALVGPFDDIVLPSYANQKVDWETELAVIIGKRAFRVSEEKAEEHIAGYSILNDVTMRDYQNRTAQWLQGKTFANTSPFGPWLVTGDEFKLGEAVATRINDELMQNSTTAELLFKPAQLISYISQIVPLNPGDVISTGTPGGIGHARKPARYLDAGDLMISEIAGIGKMKNLIVFGD